MNELIERARELRPFVEQQAAETERLTHISEGLHDRFERAGFYRMLMPKRYGGIETDLPTYLKVWIEIARADPSAAWCGCLAANHSRNFSTANRVRLEEPQYC
jgi:3-hydroxy-9,10-secoandrosta-1,3,5(10)-triene-9,17-dione monooxygenase